MYLCLTKNALFDILDIMLFCFNDDVIFETGYGTVTFKAFN